MLSSNEKSHKKYNPKVDTKYDPKVDQQCNLKINQKYDPKINQKYDLKINQKLHKINLNSSLKFTQIIGMKVSDKPFGSKVLDESRDTNLYFKKLAKNILYSKKLVTDIPNFKKSVTDIPNSKKLATNIPDPNIEFSKCVLEKFHMYRDLAYLPDDLKVSTISLSFRFPTDFNIRNIAKFIDLELDKVISVKVGNNCDFMRSLVPKKKPTKKKKKKKNLLFYNQATLQIMSKFKVYKNRPTNVKLFNNGASQMSGCQNIENCLDVLQILCKELRKIKGATNSADKIVHRPFAKNPEHLDVLKIVNFKIDMINSGFNIQFEINLNKLHRILICENINCSYEPIVHAAVNIKYNYQNKANISVFVFRSGAIIITGAKSRNHIVAAYVFITKELYEHFHGIVEPDLDKIIARKDVRRLLNLDTSTQLNII